MLEKAARTAAPSGGERHCSGTWAAARGGGRGLCWSAQERSCVPVTWPSGRARAGVCVFPKSVVCGDERVVTVGVWRLAEAAVPRG